MKTQRNNAARRSVVALLLAGGLGGCVYAPPYTAYDPYPAYGYPAYVGPPVSVDLGFGFYEHHHHGGRGYGHGGGHGHGRGHGWGRR